MNSVQSEKYGVSPNVIENKSLTSERFRTLFNFHRIENLNIGEKVLVLAERVIKKLAPGKFYKQSVQNDAYFNRKKTFSIRKKQKIDKIDYYWLKNLQNNRNLTKWFQRTELLAINNNFVI